MIISALALLPLALTAFSSPLPSNTARQISPGPWCDGIGIGVFDIAYNFTLAAYNSSLPNANTTGAPLVLGQAGAIDGAEFSVLSTWASFPYNEFPSFTLSHGALQPNSPNNISIVDTAVNPGDQPGFLEEDDAPPAAQIYCGVADTDPAGGGTGFPELAVNSDTDSFFLCSAGNSSLAQTNVVYKPDPNSLEYDYASCYPVKLQMIGLF